MLRFLKRFLLLLLIALPAITYNNQICLADSVEDVDDEGTVETEEAENIVESVAQTETEEEESDERPQPSKSAETQILFTKPVTPTDLPAGQIVNFLVGFSNIGDTDFTLETMEASFRYPMDYSFYIQNFSTIAYTRVVKPKEQASLAYSFIPSEAFSARPFGLVVNLRYSDANGNHYLNSVFNETVNIAELDEGLDGETFFLYILMAAGAVLLLVAGQQFLSTFTKRKSGSKSKKTIEVGTSNPNDVDYDWIPKELLQNLNNAGKKDKHSGKSPKPSKQSPKSNKPTASPKSNKTSPKQRKVKRNAGADD